jgi:hypothetical protein
MIMTAEIPSATACSKVKRTTELDGLFINTARISGAVERSKGRRSSSAAKDCHSASSRRCTASSIGATVSAR